MNNAKFLRGIAGEMDAAEGKQSEKGDRLAALADELESHVLVPRNKLRIALNGPNEDDPQTGTLGMADAFIQREACEELRAMLKENSDER